jgi:NAD(P)-dependent dehydrogenase (short-subunit alcohol dehydrogenase family)
MAISFDGQVALETGSGSGLGRAYALELARLGAKVVVNDLGGSVEGEGGEHTPADQVVNEIKEAGGEAVANYESVSEYEGGYNMVKQAVDTWGRLDVAICNAGILRDRAIHNMSEQEWDAVIAVHLKGCYTVVRHAWPVFRQQSYGRVVMASSTSGIYGNFGQGNYGAAKMGMVGLMNCLKIEGEKYNINAHCIAPGASTRMTQNLGAGIDMGPEHVAPVVAYLASKDCQQSGLVIEAAAGRYGRAAVVKNKPVNYDASEVPSVDWVAEKWGDITSLEGAVPMWGFRETYDEHMKARQQAKQG